MLAACSASIVADGTGGAGGGAAGAGAHGPVECTTAAVDHTKECPTTPCGMASGVAVGGTLFTVGHRPLDPATGAATPAAGQVQVSVESVVAALDPRRWGLVVAEERPRPAAGTGVDAVIRARRVA